VRPSAIQPESSRSPGVNFNVPRGSKRPGAALHPNQLIPVFRHNPAMQFTTAQLDEAYTWLCRQRRHFPPDADIWWFRRCYLDVRSELLQEINSGAYRFSPQQKIIKSSGEVIHLWGSQDVLVMKLLASAFTRYYCLDSRARNALCDWRCCCLLDDRSCKFFSVRLSRRSVLTNRTPRVID
jgi:hypothetical protein